MRVDVCNVVLLFGWLISTFHVLRSNFTITGESSRCRCDVCSNTNETKCECCNGELFTDELESTNKSFGDSRNISKHLDPMILTDDHEADLLKRRKLVKRKRKVGTSIHFSIREQNIVKQLLGGDEVNCKIIKLTPKVLINTTEDPQNYLELHFQPKMRRRTNIRITDRARVIYRDSDLIMLISLHGVNHYLEIQHQIDERSDIQGDKSRTFLEFNGGILQHFSGTVPIFVEKVDINNVIDLVNPSFVLIISRFSILVYLFMAILVLCSLLICISCNFGQ